MITIGCSRSTYYLNSLVRVIELGKWKVVVFDSGILHLFSGKIVSPYLWEYPFERVFRRPNFAFEAKE
jgi:hypothetical protein